MFTLILVIVAFWMLFSERFRVGMLGKRFLPLDHTIQVAGVLLTYLGCGLAIWHAPTWASTGAPESR